MSRGHARTSLKSHVVGLVANWKLPYKGGRDGHLKAPEVYEQRPPEANDDVPDVPCIVVHLGSVRQAQSKEGEPERVGAVTIVVLTYAEDSEQGYRDAENLVESLELDLITSPWLDGGRYKLEGPWETDVANSSRCVFEASLTCSLVFEPIRTLEGPDRRALEGII